MAKSNKQETNMKKENNETLLESTTNEAINGEAIVESTIPSSKPKSVRPVTSKTKPEDFTGVIEESASIISMVKGFEGQVETAFKIKEALEAELDATRMKLSEQLGARAHLEAQVESLEEQVAATEQLREDRDFAEEERNKLSNQLVQIQSQHEAVTAECDRLTEQAASAAKYTKEIEGEKMALEAQVMKLKAKITDTDSLRKELTDITGANRDLREQVRDLSRRLEASAASLEASAMANDALKTELAEVHQTERGLHEEIEALREKIASCEGRSGDMRIQLEDQQAINRDLLLTKSRLQNEVKMLNVKYEASKNELDAFKNAMRDIRSETSLTSGRVRQRYFKPNE